MADARAAALAMLIRNVTELTTVAALGAQRILAAIQNEDVSIKDIVEAQDRTKEALDSFKKAADLE